LYAAAVEGVSPEIQAQIDKEKSECAVTLQAIAAKRAVQPQLSKEVVVIGIDDDLYTGAANAAFHEIPELTERHAGAIGVVLVRGRGADLADKMGEAVSKAQSNGLKVRNVVTQLHTKNYAAIKDNKDVVNKLGCILSINANKDLNEHYIQVIRLFDLSLKIAYDYSAEDLSKALSEIMGKPIAADEVADMLAKKILEILPAMTPIKTSEAVNAYKAVKQALASL
jgi:hypothetical protein